MNNNTNFFNTPNYFQGYNNMQNSIKPPNINDPYQGFIRGNMFENLYNPYKVSKPFEIMPANEQAQILTEIDSLEFALIDLDLYLDLFSNDHQVINLFNKYRRELNEKINIYENKYGPLNLNSDSLNTYPWAWVNKPWPWEN